MSSLSIIKVLRLYTHLFLYFGVLFNTYASGALLPSRLAVIGDPIGPNQQQPNEEEYSSNVISSPLSLSLNQIEKTTGRKQSQQQQRNANGLLEKLNPRERNELKNLVDEYLKLTAFEALDNNNDDDDDESSSEQAKINFINRLYDDVDADGVVRYLRKKLGNIDDYGSVEYDEDQDVFDGFGKEETVDIDSDGIYNSNNNNKFNLLYKKLNIQQKKRSSSDNNDSYNTNHSNKGTNAKKQITIEDIEKAYKIWLRTNAKKYSIEQLKLIHAKFLKLKQEIAQMEEYDKFLNFQRVIYSHGR